MGMGPFVQIAGGLSGTALAGGIRKLMGEGNENNAAFDPTAITQQMNKKLDQALKKALGYSEDYTNQAVGQQNTSLGAATGALNQGLQGATTQANNNIGQGFQMSQALQAPYAQMGYNAADRYMDSLGLARPEMGSANMAGALTSQARLDPTLLQNLQAAAKAYGQSDPFKSLGAAPVNNTQTTQQLLAGLSSQQQQVYNNVMTNWGGDPNRANKSKAQQALKSQFLGIQGSLAQQQAAQQAQYQQQSGLFNNFSQAQQALLKATQGMSPQQFQTANAYNNGLFNQAKVI